MLLEGVVAATAALMVYHLSLARYAAFLFEAPAAFLVAAAVPLGLALGGVIPARPGPGAVGLTLAGAAAALALWTPPSATGLAALGTLPLVAGGCYLAHAFRQGRVYPAVLAGAAAGTLLWLAVLRWTGPLPGAAALAVLPLAAGVLSREPVRRGALAVVVMVGVLVTAASVRGWETAAMAALAPGKPLAQNRAGIAGSRWTSRGRVDLTDEGLLYLDGRGPLPVGPAAAADLRRDAGFIPWVGVAPGRALVIGYGTVREVRGALEAGFGEVVAVEGEPGLQGLYPDDARVTMPGRLPRQEEFDVVYLPLSQPTPPGAYGLPLDRNYTYTVEAFRAYWERLSPGGRIALVLRNEGEAWKVIRTALGVLAEQGVVPPEAYRHLMLIAGNVAGVRRPLVMVTRQPVGEREGLALLDHIFTHGGTPSFIPGAVQGGAMQSLYDGSFTLDQVVDQLPFDSRPATVDRPFFRQSETGLPAYARVPLVIGGLVTAFVLVLACRRGTGVRPGPAPVVAACAGAALVMGQIGLDRSSLVTPLALAGSLLAAGLGGCAAGWAVRPRRWLRVSLLVAAAVLAASGLFPPGPGAGIAALTSLSAALGAGVAALLGGVSPGLAPVLWPVHAAAGGLGMVGAVALAAAWGFSRALAGAGLLCLAALALSTWLPADPG